MKLKSFANIDLSTPEARKEIIKYLTDLQVDFNIYENTPDEIIEGVNSMLSILWCLAYSFPSLLARYYGKKDDPEENVRLALYNRESYLRFFEVEREQLNSLSVLGNGIITEIRKIAKKLCEYIEYYAPFPVKVTKYNILLIN